MGVKMKPAIVLASGSPRRREILTSLGLDFRVIPGNASEDLDEGISPEVAVSELSRRKAMAVASGLSEETLIIGSDTVIANDGRILGKPQDDDDAFRMLSNLRGATHQVLTGVTVLDTASGRSETKVVSTAVTMRNYTDEEISAYVATGEPRDKAGSYAIQGLGKSMVQEIAGSFDNVVGMPSSALLELLGMFGVSSNRK
jgi:septum formation protein